MVVVYFKAYFHRTLGTRVSPRVRVCPPPPTPQLSYRTQPQHVAGRPASPSHMPSEASGSYSPEGFSTHLAQFSCAAVQPAHAHSSSGDASDLRPSVSAS
jgi:hypothetical protein